MILNRYILGMYQTNCYLLADEATKECAVIDSGCICPELEECIKLNGFNVKYLIFTHGHFDHIGGIEYYMSKYKEALVFMHKYDVEAFSSGYDVFKIQVENKGDVVKKITLQSENDILTLGNNELKIIHTSGHTKGGVCIYTDGILFSGDTLFEHSVGRTDFYGGSFDELKKSVTKKLYKLPDSTIVYPGHGNSTTTLNEKTGNPYVRA